MIILNEEAQEKKKRNDYFFEYHIYIYIKDNFGINRIKINF